jgi:hypothetical protein
MSNNLLTFVKKAVIGTVLLCLSGLSNAATLTVSPSVISNTYGGVITLNITGLTNGEQVQIRKNFDVNANGTVDPGEPIMESFKIVDGGAFIESGITNINVPFDSNSATGAITAALNFAPPRALENMVGQYIFTLSSPSGRFSPQQAVFAVTNAPLSQSISGIVHGNEVAPVPYAVVVVLNYPSQIYAGGVVADGTGHYQLNLNPGAYQIMSVFPGYVADGSLMPQVTLTNGMAATNDLFLTNGTVTISGSVSDASGSTPAGVMINLKSGSLMAVAFTDTNGDYSATVTPAIWKVNVESDNMVQPACVVSQNKVQVDTTGGSVTGANLTLYKANALFYGRITDTNGAPFANIAFKAQDESQQFAASGFSDASGNYCVAVFGGTNVWTCSPDGDTPPLSSCIISSGFLTNMAPGQAVLCNFTAIPVSAQISGHLQDNLGHALAGVGISASANINGYYFNASADTDTNGNYFLATAAGTWNVGVNSIGNDGLFSNYGLVVTNSHVVTIPPTNAVVNITAYPPSPLLLNGGTLPPGHVNAGYNFSVSPSGGLPPYSFSLAPGSDPLPPGLFLSGTGLIFGTPTNSGTFSFTVRVTDQTPANADASFSIVVDQSPAGLLLGAPALNPDGSFQFGFMSAPGTTYTIQSSSNLFTWISVLSFQSPGGPMLIVDPNAAGSSQRFYRVKIGP